MTNTIVQQSSSKVKDSMLFKTLNHGRIEHYLAQEILLDTDELARDVLAVNGFTTAFEDGFVKDEKVWKFYGVTEKYFNGILGRNYISNRALPECVHRERGAAFVTLSPRITLALCAIMYAGRNIPEDSKVMQVYKSLKGTRYYARAEERWNALQKEYAEETKKHSAALSFVEHALENEEDYIRVTSLGRVEISVANLAKLVEYMLNSPTIQPEQPKIQEKEIHPTKAIRKDRRKRVVLFSADGRRQEFESMTACAKDINCTLQAVSRACSEGGTVHGYKISLV